MNLDDYLKQTRQNQTEFGHVLTPPASQALVSQWIRGVTRITLAYALQIERQTDGQVTPQDCSDMYLKTGSTRSRPVEPASA